MNESTLNLPLSRRRALICVAASLVVAGCGSGRNRAQPSAAGDHALTFRIVWPPTSSTPADASNTREVPEGTGSIAVEVYQGGRRVAGPRTSDNPVIGGETRLSLDSLPAGEVTIKARAHRDRAGSGAVLAQGEVTFFIKTNVDSPETFITLARVTNGGGTDPGGSPGVPENASSFVADVTVPDGTTFSSNTRFDKVWRIRNSGTVAWNAGYRFGFDAGDSLGAPGTITVPDVAPGAIWEPSVPMQAPDSAGHYRSYWRMRMPDGTSFGTQFYADINVEASRDGAVYVADVTVPDGTEVRSGSQFEKVWRLKNTGTTVWDGGYRWVFDGQEGFGNPDGIGAPGIGPGGTWDVHVPLTAPSLPGRYRGYWRMASPSGTRFGDRCWVEVVVVAGGSQTGTETIVSESDLTSEGSVGFAKTGTPRWWLDIGGVGDGGHMFATQPNGDAVDNVGDWRPNLPESREYDVYAYIPGNWASTRNAVYEIYRQGENIAAVPVNQRLYSDEWKLLGRFYFPAGSGNNIRLADRTGEAYGARGVYIGYDSIKWVAV